MEALKKSLLLISIEKEINITYVMLLGKDEGTFSDFFVLNKKIEKTIFYQ